MPPHIIDARSLPKCLRDDTLMKPYNEEDQLLYSLHNYLMQQHARNGPSAAAGASSDG